MLYNVIPCYTMSYHVIQCHTMSYNVIPCYTMSYHVTQYLLYRKKKRGKGKGERGKNHWLNDIFSLKRLTKFTIFFEICNRKRIVVQLNLSTQPISKEKSTILGES